MASTQLLSPRGAFDVTPAASLDVSALDALCSASLDALLAATADGAGARAAPQQQQQQQRTPTPPAGASPVPAIEAPAAASVAASPIDPERAARAAAARERVAASWQYRKTGSAPAAAVLASLGAKWLPAGGPQALTDTGSALIAAHGLDDTFYVYDLGNTVRLWRAWRAALPRVQPFYAVKCNPEPGMLRLLASMGAGFDCASKAELESVLALGVPPSRIIFAHPCKRGSDIRYAREHGVLYTTFDSESELAKLAAGYPCVGCVLRIR